MHEAVRLPYGDMNVTVNHNADTTNLFGFFYIEHISLVIEK